MNETLISKMKPLQEAYNRTMWEKESILAFQRGQTDYHKLTDRDKEMFRMKVTNITPEAITLLYTGTLTEEDYGHLKNPLK